MDFLSVCVVYCMVAVSMMFCDVCVCLLCGHSMFVVSMMFCVFVVCVCEFTVWTQYVCCVFAVCMVFAMCSRCVYVCSTWMCVCSVCV